MILGSTFEEEKEISENAGDAAIRLSDTPRA